LHKRFPLVQGFAHFIQVKMQIADSKAPRIAAIRELLDRRYGQARQTTEVILPENDIIQTMLDDIDRRDRITEREKAFRWHGSEKHGR
jgi:hypothetical protein